MKKTTLNQLCKLLFIICILGISPKSMAQKDSGKSITKDNRTITNSEAMKALSKYLSKSELEKVRNSVTKSFQGINENNKQKVDGGIKEIQEILATARNRTKIPTKGTRGSYDPTNDCGDRCQTDCGWNPVCYGYCWWKCMIDGGPPPTTVQ